MLQNRLFWASRSGFGAAICAAVVHNSLLLRNSMFADASGMVVPRFFVAAAACVIFMSFAAES